MYKAVKGKISKSVNIGVGWLLARDLNLCQLHCGLTTTTAPTHYYYWPKPSAVFAVFSICIVGCIVICIVGARITAQQCECESGRTKGARRTARPVTE